MVIKYYNVLNVVVIKFMCRNFTIACTNKIKKSILISSSHDIYANLALEDWLYRNYNFTDNLVLMLWINDPCVVIGRHQNPWTEANVAKLSKITEKGVRFARRNSGGGTVYHDRGNLNLTFFTPINEYNRKRNLELIVRAVYNRYGLNINITPREDLFINDSKVSGTAARLGRLNAYHHCTLLVDVNKENLHEALRKQPLEIKTTATESIRSQISNLSELNPEITVDGLMSAIVNEFMNRESDTEYSLQKVKPVDELFPGISKLRENFVNWDWCFGKTPKFCVSGTFAVPPRLLCSGVKKCDLRVTVVVEQGRVCDATVHFPEGFSSGGFCGEVSVVADLQGRKFPVDIVDFCGWKLNDIGSDCTNEKCDFVAECVGKIVTIV